MTFAGERSPAVMEQRRNRAMGLVAFAFLMPFALAIGQEVPMYEATGSVEFALDGETHQFFTTWNTVPGEPGRQIHTGSWTVLKPMMMGGVNLSPDDVFVVVSARPTVNPIAGQPELRIEFSLDPGTLEHRSSVPVAVRYESGSAEPLVWESATVLSLQAESVDDETIKLRAELVGSEQDGSGELRALLDLHSVRKR